MNEHLQARVIRKQQQAIRNEYRTTVYATLAFATELILKGLSGRVPVQPFVDYENASHAYDLASITPDDVLLREQERATVRNPQHRRAMRPQRNDEAFG